MLRILFVLVLLMTRAAHAEMRSESGDVYLSTARSPWELKVPAGGLKLVEEKRKEDGSGSYYHFEGPGAGVNFSLFLEPVGECRTAQECREMTWKRPNPYVKDPREVERFEENGFAVIRYIVPSVQGVTVNQLNWSAHAVRDGYWVDIHLSKFDARSDDDALLRGVLKSASFSKKAQEATVVKNLERRFLLPDHGAVAMTVPPTWIDRVRQPPDRLPPTIVFAPEMGNTFQIMVTPLWPGKKDAPVPSDRDIRSRVERSVDDVRSQAVEASIPVRELKREGVRGYYFSVTDKASKAGEFKFMTQGTVVAGELVILFTVLSNDTTGKIANDAVVMIGSIRHMK